MILYLEALAALALSLSLLMTGAWMMQQRTGNSGWVNTIWSLRIGLHIAVRRSADHPRYAAFPRQWGVDAPRRMFVFLLPPHKGVVT
jgi:steroid 5-alpha reductase family enzyme